MEQTIIKKEPLGKGFFVNVTKHHTFGTDAILLADFAHAKKSDLFLDLGTGCGIIPLILLRDGLLKSAVGVDISHEACMLCNKTIKELALQNFSVIEGNLTNLSGKTEFGVYNLITCNPPYKAPGAGIKNPDAVKSVARHEVECSLEDIVKTAARLLQTSGRFCVCHRPERLAELLDLMRLYKLEPKRLRCVTQRLGQKPWLVLVEGKKCANTGLIIEPELYIEQDGNFSEEMLKIYSVYKEAYL
ncbi:MAG: methyltransferase [Clostridia bacterium]|nr:methyltransferase [Clostridia bacterium]